MVLFYKNKKIISLEEIYKYLEIYHNENIFISQNIIKVICLKKF